MEGGVGGAEEAIGLGWTAAHQRCAAWANIAADELAAATSVAVGGFGGRGGEHV